MSLEMSNFDLLTFGGYEDSVEFNEDAFWSEPGILPVVSAISGSVRLIVNVALGVFNVLKTIVYSAAGFRQLLSGDNPTGFELAKDSTMGLAVNVGFCAFAIFEMIPVVGNIAHLCFRWHK